MKRPAGVSTGGLPSLAQREPSVTLGMFTHLNNLISDPNWDDGAPKGKICLMVFSDESAVRVLLKLENDCLKTSTVGRTLDDALIALDSLLGTGQAIWEQDAPRGGAGKKKSK